MESLEQNGTGITETIFLACEYSRFSLLLAAKDFLPERNVLSGEEQRETAVFAGYNLSHNTTFRHVGLSDVVLSKYPNKFQIS